MSPPIYATNTRALCISLIRLPWSDAIQLAKAVRGDTEILDCLCHDMYKSGLHRIYGDTRYWISTGPSGRVDRRNTHYARISREFPITLVFRDNSFFDNFEILDNTTGPSEIEALLVLMHRMIPAHLVHRERD
ncbi:uncharacterized protein BKCO1_1100066 [Diplodia corticola]|uniref:Uncharacterized protein n=1 Tax=Diplodia corticola TaxID=236234 RepID=A0A1J9R745_9PEZI|nr:uncharacterized protein BKCO1_1100066 [Diplodia corticola]OJD36424.1 hypothetical protein BKCO1_1100066 [Diplodia corticola]